jgi:hypothetical protein
MTTPHLPPGWELRDQALVFILMYAMIEKAGSRMPRVSVGYLLRMEVAVPTPDEQRRIASITQQTRENRNTTVQQEIITKDGETLLSRPNENDKLDMEK